MLIQGNPQSNVPSSPAGAGSGILQAPLGEMAVSELMAKYSYLARSGKIFSTFNTSGASTPIAYTSTAGIGAGMLWNPPNSGVNLHILGVSVVITTATSVPCTLGIGGAGGQTSAPSSPTAATLPGASTLVGGPSPAGQATKLGTVVDAAAFFLPLFAIGSTNAVTNEVATAYVDIGGAVVVPPGCWAGIIASAVPTSGVFQTGLIWAELPV